MLQCVQKIYHKFFDIVFKIGLTMNSKCYMIKKLLKKHALMAELADAQD